MRRLAMASLAVAALVCGCSSASNHPTAGQQRTPATQATSPAKLPLSRSCLIVDSDAGSLASLTTSLPRANPPVELGDMVQSARFLVRHMSEAVGSGKEPQLNRDLYELKQELESMTHLPVVDQRVARAAETRLKRISEQAIEICSHSKPGSD